MTQDQNLPDRRAMDDKFSLVYEELCRLASNLLHQEVHATIRSAALVNEAWIKLKDSPTLANTSTVHFKAIAASAMRHVLVEEARRRNAQKRGGGQAVLVTLGDEDSPIRPIDTELLDLDTALQELAGVNERQAIIVENIFFAGMTIAETALYMTVSESLVERDWRAAKAWLATRLRPSGK